MMGGDWKTSELILQKKSTKREQKTKMGLRNTPFTSVMSSSSSPSMSFVQATVVAVFALVWCFNTVTESFQFQTTTTIITNNTPKKPVSTIAERRGGYQRSSIRPQRDMFTFYENTMQTNKYNNNNCNGPSLHLFGRNKQNEVEGGETNNNRDSNSGNEDENEKKKSRSSVPFFGRLLNRQQEKESGSTDTNTSASAPASALPATSGTATITQQDKTSITPTGVSANTAEKQEKKEPPSPKDWLAMAERTRLEAEKLDAELTLTKIEKLEKKLTKTKAAAAVNGSSESVTTTTKRNDGTTVDDIQYELDVLQAKLRGDPTPVKAASAATTSVTTPQSQEIVSASASSSTNYSDEDVNVISSTIDDSKVIEAAKKIAADSNDNYKFQTEEDLEKIPNFLLKILAAFVGMDVNKIDKKEFLKRWEMTRNLDYSYFTDKTAPTFTPMDIVGKKRDILNNKNNTAFGDDQLMVVTEEMIEKANGNATQLALYALESDYYLEMGGNILTSVPIEDITPDFVKGLLNESYFGSMYPKCVIARDELQNNGGENDDSSYVSEEPTMAQIDVLTKTILPAIKFASSSKAMKVPGGYAITGSHKFKTGDELIDAIDAEILKSRPNLNDQLTVLYTPSYGPIDNNFTIGGESLESLSNMNMDSLFDEDPMSSDLFANPEPILYVTGPDIVRKPNRIGLSLASMAGLATAWYASVYPFLLNDQIASRVDADMKLIEANLQPDLSYLTDYTVPLFWSFIGLQLAHEFAHSAVARSKNVKLSVPVFVPSFITGITSSVTTFKTLPKNKNDMFDISAAGPLVGITLSSIVLAIGAKLTLISDPASLPALPVDILRQSTLGGAIIDNIITGSLYVPEGAPSANLNIPLHPLAIAGYTSLLVNGLALLPIGSKLFSRFA